MIRTPTLPLRPLITILTVGCLNAVAVLAQRGNPTVTCLDTMVINARTVMVGRVVEASPYRDGLRSNVVFAVEKRLKGEVSDRTEVLILASESNLDTWKVQGHRLLIAVPKDGRVRADNLAEGDESAIDLSASDLRVLRADMTILQDADSVVAAAEEVLRTHPGVYRTFKRTIPIVPARMLRPDPFFPRHCELDEIWSLYCLITFVPVDEALERWAREAITSEHVWERAEGAEALGHFPSAVNVALLTWLLGDPGLYTVANVPLYWVRQQAYKALRSYGVQVPEPVLRP